MNGSGTGPRQQARSPDRVAITMSRFPKLSETFILNEVLELERRGLAVELFPLLRERAAVTHPEALRLDRAAHHLRVLSIEVLAAQWHWLGRRPGAYLAVWRGALAGNVRSPRSLLRVPFVLLKAAAFARRMEALGVRRVHAHYSTHPALAAWAVSRLTGIPFSFTAHAHDLYVDRSMLAEKLADAEFVTTISDYNRELIRRELGPAAAAKTLVVRCGVEPGFHRGTPARAGGRPFTVACVGSLEEYKGQRYLIDAVARLRAGGLEVHCLLVGTGPLRGRLERRARSGGVADRVRFLGALPQSEVQLALARADAYVQPSVITRSLKMEGIPVALMEAMASGLPVIATEISGISELVVPGRTGLLVRERDSAALAISLRRLIADPGLRRGLADAGCEKVRTEYDLRRNAGALADLLGADRLETGAIEIEEAAVA